MSEVRRATRANWWRWAWPAEASELEKIEAEIEALKARKTLLRRRIKSRRRYQLFGKPGRPLPQWKAAILEEPCRAAG